MRRVSTLLVSRSRSRILKHFVSTTLKTPFFHRFFDSLFPWGISPTDWKSADLRPCRPLDMFMLSPSPPKDPETLISSLLVNQSDVVLNIL